MERQTWNSWSENGLERVRAGEQLPGLDVGGFEKRERWCFWGTMTRERGAEEPGAVDKGS